MKQKEAVLKVILFIVFRNTWLGNLRLLIVHLTVKRPLTTYLLLLKIEKVVFCEKSLLKR